MIQTSTRLKKNDAGHGLRCCLNEKWWIICPSYQRMIYYSIILYNEWRRSSFHFLRPFLLHEWIYPDSTSFLTLSCLTYTYVVHDDGLNSDRAYTVFSSFSHQALERSKTWKSNNMHTPIKRASFNTTVEISPNTLHIFSPWWEGVQRHGRHAHTVYTR